MAEIAGHFDVEKIRECFPLIAELSKGDKPLRYLDSAASTQKPQAVIDALTKFYSHDYANIHRGVHFLSQRATDAYEKARETARRFVNAKDAAECIFVRNATEGVNLVASSYAKSRLNKPGANIVLTTMEHHANIVPWQMAIEGSGAKLRVVPIDGKGVLDVEAFEKLVDENTLIVGLSYVSNVLGTVNPVKELVAKAHARGAKVLVDAAQAAPHRRIDVADLDCDFLVLSGHKIYGPTGIGLLYGRRALLEKMPPYQGGGDMILTVSFAKTTYKGIPDRFEAGTPHIAGAIGMAAAMNFMETVGLTNISAHEESLLKYAEELLLPIKGLKEIGTAPGKAAVFSFTVEGVHPHDIGTFLDADGIAIRAGHHCAEPLMKFLGIPGTARASFGMYNTREEVETLAASLDKIVKFFA
ncbi:MAG TPA: cysteine desulfurase [Opitutales bacterium]|nr:cysteine desulfurase [Opitutales bacterium]